MVSECASFRVVQGKAYGWSYAMGGSELGVATEG